MADNHIITMITDFGTQDHYVGAIKAAVLSVAPAANIVDITHEIPPHDIREAAWVLRNSYARFPHRTVHIAVADPVVGMIQRPILAVTEHHTFVAPDNGVLSFVFEVEPPTRVIELTASHYMSDTICPTFHARDIFAPVAAHLASGIDPGNFGDPIQDFKILDMGRPKIGPEGSIKVTVAHVDRFGNVILNLTRKALGRILEKFKADAFSITVEGIRIETLVKTYGEAQAGAPFMLYNSSDYLEIAANQARAAEMLKLRAGDPVDLMPVRT